MTITGENDGLTHEATLSVTTQTITVSGTVRGARQNIRVGIVGKPSILSGTGGAFTFTDVIPPYDLYTVAESGFTNTPIPDMFFFKGLTRTDPTVSAAVTSSNILVLICGVVTPCPSSTISGTRSGQGSGQTDPIILQWSTGGQTTTIAPNNTYSLNGTWSGGASQSGNLHGLQFTRKVSGGPDQFIGYGRSGNVTLDDGVNETINLAFNTVGSTGAISGNITPAPNLSAPTMTLYQEFGSVSAPLWTTNSTTSVDANFPILSLAGGNSFHVSQSMSGYTSSYVYPLTQTADVTFEMLIPPNHMTPADAATGVAATTPLTWSGGSNVISKVAVLCPGARYHIFTSGNESTIPANEDLPLPAAASCTWTIEAFGPTADVNDAAATNELETVLATDYSGPPHGFASVSTPRTFTTP